MSYEVTAKTAAALTTITSSEPQFPMEPCWQKTKKFQLGFAKIFNVHKHFCTSVRSQGFEKEGRLARSLPYFIQSHSVFIIFLIHFCMDDWHFTEAEKIKHFYFHVCTCFCLNREFFFFLTATAFRTLFCGVVVGSCQIQKVGFVPAIPWASCLKLLQCRIYTSIFFYFLLYIKKILSSELCNASIETCIVIVWCCLTKF